MLKKVAMQVSVFRILYGIACEGTHIYYNYGLLLMHICAGICGKQGNCCWLSCLPAHMHLALDYAVCNIAHMEIFYFAYRNFQSL